MYDSLNNYIPTLLDYLSGRKLLVSAEKSSVTLFTPWTYEAHVEPQVFANGTRIPTVKQPTILGVKFDTMFTYAPHCRAATTRTRERTNVMKALAGTSWGQDVDTLTLTYRTVIRPVAEYGAPIWSPILSTTGWNKLEAAQNDALRVATGCHAMADQAHLCTETKILPLRKHAELLSRQYLVSCHLAGHPSNNLVTPNEPPRPMKNTLAYAHRQEITTRLPPPTQFIDERHKKHVIADMHRDTVREAINGYDPNKVIGRRPPAVHVEEETLERRTRTRLSQLRSSYSIILNNYRHRIDDTTPDTCPECGVSPHDTNHLFACTANPTLLTPLDLWERPVEVAAFLGI